MFFRKLPFLACASLFATFAVHPSAHAQFWPCNPMCCQPVRVTACCPTVPVTEMRECKQIVQRPVVETTYVDQPVTEYRQVVETKTAEVPTCTYQNVTEMRTVQRDCGRWVSQTYQRPMVSPCEYDNRNDLFGALNRTGYAVRMAFTPQTWTERNYVPNVVTTQVPVTRQVAVRGTKTVNYQVARVVPVTTTRRVAVNTVKLVSEEVVTKRPVIVYRPAVPGTGVAQGKPNSGPTTTASAAETIQPTPVGKATAINPRKSSEPTKITRRINEDLNDQPDAVNRGEGSGQKPAKEATPPSDEHGSLRVAPSEESSDEADEQYARRDAPVGQWVARWRSQPATIDGPKFPEVAESAPKNKKR